MSVDTVPLYTHIYTYVRGIMYIYKYTHIYMCICICVCIHTYIYTHVYKKHVLLLSHSSFLLWILCPYMNENTVFSVAIFSLEKKGQN